MTDRISSKSTTTVTDTSLTGIDDGDGKDKKSGTGVTDKAPTVTKETTDRRDGAPPIAPPKQDLSDLMAKLQEIQSRTDETQVKSKTTQIDKNKQKMDTQLKEQLKKIEEAQKKMESQKKWGLFGKIFGGIAVGLAVVAAVATGGALAIVAASAAALLFASQTIEVGNGKSLLNAGLEGMFKAFGLKDEALADAVKWTSLGLNIAVMALGLGAAGGAMMAAKAGNLVVKMPQLVLAVGFAQGATSVGQGVTGIGTSVSGYEATMANVDVKKLDAKQLEVQRQMDKLIEDLKKMMEKMEESTNIAVETIGATDASVRKQMQTMSGRA